MAYVINTVLITVIQFAIASTLDESAGEELQFDIGLTFLEEVRVPARDPGVLAELAASPGTTVKAGMILAQLDDTKAKLLRDQAQIELNNAKRLAEHDLKIRLSRKAHEVAAAELVRATEAAKRFEKSVSKSELDRLRLETERAALEIDQSQFDFETAQLAVQAKEATLHLAEHALALRRIVARSPGLVVEVLKQPGEWVEPGELVARIVRMDRLRAEGFLPAQQATMELVGKKATLIVAQGDEPAVEYNGKVTFVSPEIHPVNGMVRVWAEVQNRDLTLRPGLQATLKILP